MPLEDKERAEDERGGGEREDDKRDEAARRPLDFGAAHGREELLALARGLARLPVLRRLERREEHERACDPEEGEHCTIARGGQRSPFRGRDREMGDSRKPNLKRYIASVGWSDTGVYAGGSTHVACS